RLLAPGLVWGSCGRLHLPTLLGGGDAALWTAKIFQDQVEMITGGPCPRPCRDRAGACRARVIMPAALTRMVYAVQTNAGGRVLWADVHHRRNCLGTGTYRDGAARTEHAARRWIQRARDIALEHDPVTGRVGIWHWRAGEQGSRVGVTRGGEDRL